MYPDPKEVISVFATLHLLFFYVVGLGIMSRFCIEPLLP